MLVLEAMPKAAVVYLFLARLALLEAIIPREICPSLPHTHPTVYSTLSFPATVHRAFIPPRRGAA